MKGKDKSKKAAKPSKSAAMSAEEATRKELDEANKNICLLSSRLMRIESEYKELHRVMELIKESGLLDKKDQLEPADVVLSKNFYDEYIPTLKEWIGLSNYTVVYDSDEHGLTTRTFNDKVCGKSNTLTLIQTTAGCIFGSYNAIEIPDSKENSYGFYLTKDEDFFTFVLKSPVVTKPLKITKKDTFYSGKIYAPDNDKWITGIHCGYYIGLQDASFISGKFPMYYNIDIDNAVNVFTGNHFPATFSVYKVVVLGWTE